ncbi:MAG: HsdR family type I site-specific deoxyribonuclease [Gemmatimonadaceae bacterium]
MTEADLPTPEWREDEISQIPALQLLVNLGWQYLTPAEALALRGGRRGRVVLTEVLSAKLRELNVIRYKGESLRFTEENIQAGVRALDELTPQEGLIRANEKAYDLLRLGKSLQQSVRGDLRSFTLQYVDWDHVERNAFHVTEEFAVEPSGARDARRPDVVCFVNGVPLVVIECKQPALKDPIHEAISQHIRNQKDEYIPRLFVFAQLLLALSMNEARHATAGTSEKFWAVWREERLDEDALAELVNHPLPAEVADRLFADRFRHVRRYFDTLAREGRAVTEQDRALWSLCRPERLLELTRRFVVYDAGEKKIARHQQYVCVNRTLEHVQYVGTDGARPGGVVWHTQGSGKSLTMVMLAAALFEEIGAGATRKIILVTDRVDLDDQIWRTFQHCGLEPVRARTGRHLAELLASDKASVITTVIDKFEAVTKLGRRFESPDIFVLVDESHRGQYGALHARMRRVLSHACFLGFTGTPVVRAEKNTIEKFGGLIHSYTIAEAVEDRAVVQLLYEGRDVPQAVDREQMDRWFERITARLTPEQAADLKRKFSSAPQLNQAEQRITAIAWDVSAHFADTWQGTGFKGQLVAPSKLAALRYKAAMDECGLVTSAVLISAPDDREGDDDLYEENKSAVVTFWRGMMAKYGTEKAYNDQLISAFKGPDDPEILIVVDKLLTGFDAPRNTVLYLTRPLKEHTLLQAIARVNRVHEGKDFGYIIDYAGVLHRLGEALDLYGSLAGFDAEDLEGTLADVGEEIAKLPQRHSDVWEVFKTVRNRRDQEEYERLLADEALRDEFYRALSAYARTLAVALGSARFLEETPEERARKYRSDLKFFEALRRSVRRRYAEVVDFREYEPKIQRLLDRHVGAGEVETITPLVNIFDQEAFAREVELAGTPGAQADTIAHRMRRTITERMDEDPAAYRRFSQLLEETIAEWRARRLDDAEYLRRVRELGERVVSRGVEEVPEDVRYSQDARAIFGLVRESIAPYAAGRTDLETVSAATAAAIERAIDSRRVVNWTESVDVQNRMRTDIEDELFTLRERHGVPLTLDDIDQVMERVLDVARVRKAS